MAQTWTNGEARPGRPLKRQNPGSESRVLLPRGSVPVGHIPSAGLVLYCTVLKFSLPVKHHRRFSSPHGRHVREPFLIPSSSSWKASWSV